MAGDDHEDTGRSDRAGVAGAAAKDIEAVWYAHETGYFEVPRRTSLSGLADVLDVSDREASKRLRRGIAALIESSEEFDRRTRTRGGSPRGVKQRP